MADNFVSMIVTPLSRETLLQAVNVLPAGPQILARLGTLLRDDSTNVEDVVAVIRRDNALTARVLRVANSVAYRGEEPVASLEEALVRVGFAEIYRITGFAVAAQVAGQFLPLYETTGAQLRENALLTALIMEALADAAGFDPRAAYTAGLLRGTGKIALDRAAKTANLEVSYDSGFGPLADWEKATLGLSNCEASAVVLEGWRFSSVTIDAIHDHYAPPGEKSLALLLNLAAGVAERCGHGLPGEVSYWDVAGERLLGCGIGSEQLDEATRRALESFGPVRMAVA